MRSLKTTNLFVVCLVFILAQIKAQSRTTCTTPNGEIAQCISIHSCSILYNAVTTRNPQQLRFLRESQCGFGADPSVCCGSYDNYQSQTRRTTESSLFSDDPYRGTPSRRTNSDSNQNFNERPKWGNNNEDRRIPDRNTPGRGNNNRRTNSEESRERWGSQENRFPNRPGSGGSANRPTNSGSSGSGSLPDRSKCGIQTADRILDGEVTGLTEFPWMAMLQYRKSSGSLVFSCGGSLISSRYVLTAAHCVKGQILTKIGPLVNVRLGEYNTDTEEDCNNQLGYEMCNDKPFDSGIVKTIPHSDYDESSVDRYNDIALIKLKREAPSTDFIAPICLPSRLERANVGDKLVVAGWGRTEYSSSSPVKLKLRVPVVESSQCSRTFRTAGVSLGSRQLCAGGERGRDSCNGDSGGPLMSTTKNDSAQWYIEGVVSFGAKCGSEGWPGVYTKVKDYLDWIKRNVD